MQHSKERTVVYTFVFTEQEAAWLQAALGAAGNSGEEGEDAFLTDLYDALAP